MNEIDSNEEHDWMVANDQEFKRLMWGQLMIEEKIVMKAYANSLVNDKRVHKILHVAVQIIMDRYPDFDVSCIP